MILNKFFLVLLYLVIHESHSIKFKNLYKDQNKILSAAKHADVGDPLILTPYVQFGKIQEGQKAALVQYEKFLGLESYAGYFTVDERFDSNLWFWYFPSADKPSEDPVMVWLNGGPGSTSLNGLFDENGPFIVNDDYSVSLREYSWHRNQSVIFVDNPVGVGFSFTKGGLAKNETKVGEDFYSLLIQFFELFPNLQQNDFYISGESYAGKYLPAIAYTILKKNPTAEQKINLKGILIGDGWTDPVSQSNYGPFVYETGLVSEEIKTLIDIHNDVIINLVQKGEYSAAAVHSNLQTNLIEINADVNIYNYIKEYGDGAWPDFVNLDEIRKVIHVGNIEFGDKGAGAALAEDEMRSVKPWVEELLENYRILFYTGQVDIICGYPMQLDYLKTLNFTGADEYTNATRFIWRVDDEAAGYVRVARNLTELLVRNAGHLVPMDQPKWAYDMVYRFTRNKPYA